MGNCCGTSQDDKKESENSKAIDKTLMADYVQQIRIIKVLLLGSGESGKSTFVKQMRIINLDGYSKDELVAYRTDIFRNVIEGSAQVAAALKLANAVPETGPLSEAVNTIISFSPSMEQITIPVTLAEAIDSAWNSCKVKDIFNKIARVTYIYDGAPYFLSNLKRIVEKDYIPTTQDILMARVKTTGINELRFKIGNNPVHMFDVGGQRSERKKWIHCFENVSSVIFISALSEYNQNLLEDNNQNRMVESFVLFNSIVNSKWFLQASFILFLNKIDLFKEKIKIIPLKMYIPEYTGPDEFEPAADFIKQKFISLNKNSITIYTHYTCATDTKQIKFLFGALKETFLSRTLIESGII